MDLLDRLPPGPDWAGLFGPLRATLLGARARLELAPAQIPPLRASEGAGPWVSVDARGIALSPSLLAEGLLTPEDAAWAAAAPEGAAGLAPDRWRRAASALLEGLALAGMMERAPEDPPMAWWRVGRAAEAVDRLFPELGALWPDLVDLLGPGEQALPRPPRRAAWLFRWLRDRGHPAATGLGPPALTDAELAAFGAWVRDLRQGPASDAPLPLQASSPEEITSWEAEPWSFRALAASAGPAGARLALEGGALAPARGLAGGELGARVAASVAGGALALRARAAGPVGTWVLASGLVQERLGAARGVELSLREDGRLEIVLADAFMGLPTAEMLALADSVGVSGWAGGRWRVVSVDEEEAGELLIERVTPKGLTLHPRGGHGFAVPAASVIRPAEQILSALSGASLRWRRDEEGLLLRGPVLGLPVELRLRPER